MIVENPQCAGFFFDAESYKKDTAKIEELQKLAEEFGVPLYEWRDGKMQAFEGLDKTNGQEISTSELLTRAPEPSSEIKRQWLEDTITERPFKINTEVQRMYTSYGDGELAYKILTEKDPRKASNAKKFSTDYALIKRKFNEDEDRVDVSVNSPENYLQETDNIVKRLEKDIQKLTVELAKPNIKYEKARSLMEEKQGYKENIETVYALVYSISETARKNDNLPIVGMIDKWLIDHSARERMQQFVSERIDEDGQLKFIEEKDVPKEVRERLVTNASLDTLKKAA